ncbi:hypothetical protein ACQY0O_002342 [Thecaphora frezii]
MVGSAGLALPTRPEDGVSAMRPAEALNIAANNHVATHSSTTLSTGFDPIADHPRSDDCRPGANTPLDQTAPYRAPPAATSSAGLAPTVPLLTGLSTWRRPTDPLTHSAPRHYRCAMVLPAC